LRGERSRALFVNRYEYVCTRVGVVPNETSAHARVHMTSIFTTKRVLQSFTLLLAVFVFFGRGAPTVFASTDVVKTCTSIVGANCYINGGSAIGGAGYTNGSGTTNGTYSAVYPSYDTAGSNDWQNTNTNISISACSSVLGSTWTACWQRFNDMGGAGINWVYQFYNNGGTYTQTFTDGVIIKSPNNGVTLEDFTNWTIQWGNLGTGLKQLGIHYSDDATILATCEEFPYGSGAGYTDCINSSPRIWADYGIATTVAGGTANITKGHQLTLGTTYYAQAVVQVTDNFGTNLAVSPIISFTIGIPTSGAVDASSCGTFDLICYIQAGSTWLFIPSQASLDNFKNLTLANSFPFSYLYDMGNLYNDAFDHGADTFSLSIPFMGSTLNIMSTSQLEAISFQGLVRTIMGAIAIFLTALFLYRKIIKVHDQNHQTV